MAVKILVSLLVVGFASSVPLTLHKGPMNVICPGGHSDCSDASTCCKNGADSYGCCPQVDAVCCNDMKHCCPNGYSCDTDNGECLKEDIPHPLLQLAVRPTVPEPSLSAQIVDCPDGITYCLSGQTCCYSFGEYDCCPYSYAVCCYDGLHCCPSGDTCSGGYCFRVHPLIVHTELPEPSVQNVICPDGTSECPDGDTCCPTDADTYGCCPKPDAMCCSDMKHCCPNGYTCDGEKCVHAGEDNIPHPLIVLAVRPKEPEPSSVQNVICPDGTSECPDGDTCCPTDADTYGCCPKPDATCCSDMKHCCPSGYTCDGEKCVREDNIPHPLIVLAVRPKEPEPSSVQNVNCLDGTSECPDGDTCCKNGADTYGCCPQVDAVCCSDMKSCCPSGYTCDVANGKCFKEDLSHPLLQLSVRPKVPEPSVQEIVCPDGHAECPDKNTCCKNDAGSYACCPSLNAVCCNDMKHCCPNGYTCDTRAGTCTKGEDLPHPLLQLTVRPEKPKVQNVYCPDGGQCPSGNTCCKEGESTYGCCPYYLAQCCGDLKHCCKYGFYCTVYGKCTHGDLSHPLLQLTVRPEKPEVQIVNCPNGGYCPDGNTCCKNSETTYACCPQVNAVCCSDMKSCCPSGYTCDNGKCFKEDLPHPLLQLAVRPKLPEPSVQDITCPDGTSECPNKNTCCKSGADSYGCCPQVDAVCCSDMKHCCKSGYTCDVGAGTCNKGEDISHPLLQLAVCPEKPEVQNINCRDGGVCPDGNTCCPTSDTTYGCCPKPDATCCDDMKHCCPNGYTCDGLKCELNGTTHPLLKLVIKRPLVGPDGGNPLPSIL